MGISGQPRLGPFRVHEPTVNSDGGLIVVTTGSGPVAALPCQFLPLLSELDARLKGDHAR